jgi:hypothetical protein
VDALASLELEIRDREDLRQKLQRGEKDSRGPGHARDREDLRQKLQR